MRYGYRALLLLTLAGLGCASKRQATQPNAPPTSGDNVIVSGMQGAGRTIVDGTKKGYQAAKSGIQKWVDPASDTASSTDSSNGTSSSTKTATSGRTVVHGHQRDSEPTRTAQASDDDPFSTNASTGSGSGSGNSTRVGSRKVGTNVADTFVIE